MLPKPIRELSHNRALRGTVRRLGLTPTFRRWYFRFAGPADGMFALRLGPAEARFRLRGPGELRLLEEAARPVGEGRWIRELARLLHPGDVAYDVGANIGMYTLPLAQRVVPRGEVVAFEPQRENHAHLLENIALNRLANVRVFPVALGDRAGSARLYRGEEVGNFSIAHSYGGTSEAVPVAPCDALVDQQKLPVPKVVKIDVEGGEMAVLRGMERTLRQPACRHVLIEVHPTMLPEGVRPDDVLEFLRACGFAEQEAVRRDTELQVLATKPAEGRTDRSNTEARNLA